MARFLVIHVSFIYVSSRCRIRGRQSDARVSESAHFATVIPCSTCSSSTFSATLFCLSRFIVSMPALIGEKKASIKHLLLTPIEELHKSDENDSQASKEDKNLVAILVFWSVVCREQYHCGNLAELVQNMFWAMVVQGTQSTQV